MKNTSKRVMTTKPSAPVERMNAYLSKLPKDKRSALEKLRRDIQSAAPDAEEWFSYQLPAFRLEGRFLVAFGAAANHCAFYPGAVVETLEVAAKGYDTSKGTIRFPANKPLPAALVRQLVKARIARLDKKARS